MLSEGRNLVRETLLACVLGLHALAAAAETQPPSPAGEPAAAGADNGKGTAEDRISELEKEVRQLKELVRSLQAQMGQTVAATPAPATPAAPAATPATPATQATAPAQSGIIGDVLHGTTINALLDGYIAYNVDSPIGRVNSLRAYDVSSNSFSLNQADLIIENAPDLAVGKRFGMRIDLQYGQATSTLQGSPTTSCAPRCIATSSRPTVATCSRCSADSRWTSASGRVRSASRATTPRTS